MTSDGIDYQRFIEDALRDAVRRLLAEVAEQGFPGDHHFYIGFHTRHPGVAIPRSLHDLYPEEMTIILQHQFWNLEVSSDAFSVELSFSASRQRLYVPFAALTMFADPSVEFALRFQARLPGSATGAGVAGLRGVEDVGGEAAMAGDAVAASDDVAATPAAPASPANRGPGGAAGRSGGPGEVIRFDPSRRR